MPDFLLAVRLMGPGWLARRVAYAARRRLGFLERATPRVAWSDVPAPELRLQRAPRRPVGFAVPEREVARGEFLLFSDRRLRAGLPPDWQRNQATGVTLPGDVHWSRLGDFAFGDIKDVWELSRFGWAFELVRRGDEESREIFGSLLQDWCACNPPNAGPNWMCGQEAAIRLQAVVFAVERLGVVPSLQVEFARLVVATGRRIAANLDYALAQQNNHGVSECVGLLTAALLVPQYPDAGNWRIRALDRLEKQLRELVYEDGAFAQHSLVYHRLALAQMCWAAVRLRGAGRAVPDWLQHAGRRATQFLAALTDPETGEAPLFGANDGANVLPLTACAFLDMRPAVQLGLAVFEQHLSYASGPWDEAACWLVEGAHALPRVPVRRTDWRGPAGGLVQLWSTDDRLVMRCPENFRHRPGHADFGHVDIWLAGQRITSDGGSFSYNSRERFTTLDQLREHNALTVDGREPMRKVTRFLRVPWPEGRVTTDGPTSFCYQPNLWPGEDLAWRRRVEKRSWGFIVSDTLAGAAGRTVRWHWRLTDVAWRLEAARLHGRVGGREIAISWIMPAGFSAQLVRADPVTATGWESRSYGRATPAVALIIVGQARGDVSIGFEFSGS